MVDVFNGRTASNTAVVTTHASVGRMPRQPPPHPPSKRYSSSPLSVRRAHLSSALTGVDGKFPSGKTVLTTASTVLRMRYSCSAACGTPPRASKRAGGQSGGRKARIR